MSTQQRTTDRFGNNLFTTPEQTAQIVQTITEFNATYTGPLPATSGSIVLINDIQGDITQSTLSETDLITIQTDTDTNSTNIGLLQTDVGLNTTAIGLLQTDVGLNTTAIGVNAGNITLNENDIIDLQQDVTDLGNEKLSLTGGTMSGNIDLDGNALFNLRTITGNGVDSVQILNGGQGLDCFVDRARIQSVNNIELSAGTNNISLESALTMNNNDIKDVSNLLVENVKSYDNVSDIVVGNTLNLGGLSDIQNIGSMTLTNTKYISKVDDLGTPIGDFYVLEDNTSYIVLGQITLQYGILYGVNCSVRGVDFSATITFDETFRNCSIKTENNNLYLSHLTIVGGGGRFFPTVNRGLIDALNYNVGAPAPFYGRNKRFKVSDVNIIRAYKVGTVEGFGTLNFTNNFVNGGGGLAGQASDYYTNEGLSVSDGLSLEFNNNKMVLFAGAQQASTTKLLNLKGRVSPLLGFNAVTITGNIFHPRNAETGVDFDPDSRTALGNISGNVFIRTGGTSPLINYTDQTTYDNYNPLSVENYSINANAGVVDSEPNLKSGIGISDSISSATATLLDPLNNAQIEAINLSARFGVQLDLTGVTTPFVIDERITDTDTGSTALIAGVDAETGGNQSVYITDMSGKFAAGGTGGFTSLTGTASGGLLRYIFRYCEKDPRKLVVTGTFSVDVGNNKEYFISPSMNGAPDSICEVSGVSSSTGAGATLTVVCNKRFNEGDKERFYFRTADASAGFVTKGIIVIK
jgi:hypothetical protein